MNMKEFQQLLSQIEDILWFPKVFIQSRNGMSWDDISAKNYFSTAWMDFFSGIYDGTFQSLVDNLINGNAVEQNDKEIAERLLPIIELLEASEPEQGTKRIGVKIDIEKFGRYGETLKEMSTKGIIFDIIRDEEDIRETYFIDFRPGDTRSYLIQSLNRILDSSRNSRESKIRELELKISEMANTNLELSTLLSGSRAEVSELKKKSEEDREKFQSVKKESNDLREQLSKFVDSVKEEETESIKNNKLRMYYLYKLGFLDDAIWNEKLSYEQRVKILCRILQGGPLKIDTALRYYKLFNSIGSVELKAYEAENEKTVFDYIKILCDIELKNGEFINSLRKK
ncbi:hypothetical protein [Sphingobacterium sp. DR205]|uniref:hypothetical protein n=1 Tax=Sphingobacterium sp. DR205 TaxID=2713573 RepID=UPI0013E51EA9|nr:hypothetical protein [Sphingobacterium sp. DR205]QIH36751.1 hypothetical protein G6053_29580 [Sphingobacterium sp. DR205]